jgi:hypothetical protein
MVRTLILASILKGIHRLSARDELYTGNSNWIQCAIETLSTHWNFHQSSHNNSKDRIAMRVALWSIIGYKKQYNS